MSEEDIKNTALQGQIAKRETSVLGVVVGFKRATSQ